MNRQRYEPVPQRDEVIILDSIHSSNYNYNSGIPNSVPSSRAPSQAPSFNPSGGPPSIHSIPNSPPPSFHTHSSPGTPRPTPSTTANADYAELWGVASTTGAETEICAGSEALATIASLRNRVERLEESIGKLLLDKEALPSLTEGEHSSSHCCVTFTDSNASLEREIATNGSHCCVTFKSTKADTVREHRRTAMMFVLAMLIIICVMVVSIKAINRGRAECRVCEPGLENH